MVFVDLDRLSAYKNFIIQHPYDLKELKPIQELTAEVAKAVRDRMISNAARQGQITYLTKIFGRGSDFICRDPAVLKAGGVHVLQTFFSEDITEQVQIEGRTCRQDDPGSYEIIVFREDLSNFSVRSSESLAQNPYAFLSDKRVQLSKKKDDQFEANMKTAEEKDAKTAQFIKLANS